MTKEQLDDLRTRPPLRIPSVLSGKWVYVRTWSFPAYGSTVVTHGQRTHSTAGWTCCAFAEGFAYKGARLQVEGLEPWACPDQGSFYANACALDAHLNSLGAEPVLVGEWPAGCTGDGARADRTPFTLEDWGAAHSEMKRRGYPDGLFAAAVVQP